MFGLRLPELLLILAVLLLLFGAQKLPQLGQGLGESLKGFRKAFQEGKEENEPRDGAGRGSPQTGPAPKSRSDRGA
jgi:sec-independent protein translocase protein TatA